MPTYYTVQRGVLQAAELRGSQKSGLGLYVEHASHVQSAKQLSGVTDTHWPSTGHSNSHYNTTPLPYDGRRLAYTLRIHYNAILPAYSVVGAYGTGIYWYIPDPARVLAPYSDPASTTASGTNTDAAFHITTQAS